MTGAARGAGNAYPSGAPDFTSGFNRGSCYPVICVSLFHVIVLSIGFLALIRLITVKKTTVSCCACFSVLNIYLRNRYNRNSNIK